MLTLIILNQNEVEIKFKSFMQYPKVQTKDTKEQVSVLQKKTSGQDISVVGKSSNPDQGYISEVVQSSTQDQGEKGYQRVRGFHSFIHTYMQLFSCHIYKLFREGSLVKLCSWKCTDTFCMTPSLAY